MSKKILLLFDVDGTIANSGKKIDVDVKQFLNSLDKNLYEFGIVGGGKKEKILYQIDNVDFLHIFSECGCEYYQKKETDYSLVYSKNIQTYNTMDGNSIAFHECIQKLVLLCLHFIANYIRVPVSGHFVDRRKGLIYISLVGMQANDRERQEFIIADNLYHYRQELLSILEKNIPENLQSFIDVKIGGSTGITIIPKEWNKSQVMDVINLTNYHQVYFFGDKYEPDGNDYELLNYKGDNFFGVPVATIKDTVDFLQKTFPLKKSF